MNVAPKQGMESTRFQAGMRYMRAKYAAEDTPPLDELNERERQLLETIVQSGGDLKDAAKRLCYAHATMRNRMTSIHQKLGTHSITHAVLVYMAGARW